MAKMSFNGLQVLAGDREIFRVSADNTDREIKNLEIIVALLQAFAEDAANGYHGDRMESFFHTETFNEVRA